MSSLVAQHSPSTCRTRPLKKLRIASQEVINSKADVPCSLERCTIPVCWVAGTVTASFSEEHFLLMV